MIDALQNWVTRQAESRPDAVAVVMGSERMTYGRLEAAARALSEQFRDWGCRPTDRVCLVMPKSPAAVVGILAALKAGAVYVPLDPASPAPRLAQMIASCQPRIVLAAPQTAALVAACRSSECIGPRFAVVGMDGPLSARLESAAVEPWDHPVGPEEVPSGAAYILFTSGSTGQPKGVVITHANVIAYIEWAVRYFGLNASDRLSGHPPLHFDLSMFDLFGAFAAGAELHLVSPDLNLRPHALAEFIRHHELTQWFSVPSVLNYLAKFDAVRFNDFPSLKRLLWCGEVLPTPVLIHWMTRLVGVRFTNLYGPTEATIASSYHTLTTCPQDGRTPVPIGRACDGEDLLVLDDALRPAPAGEVGHLYIGGVGLSPGYWRDPAKTAAVFLPHPDHPPGAARVYRTGDLARVGDDGLVYFLGRADTQIKSRGYRIELGEIEAALAALSSVREAAVVAIHSEGFEGSVICCAYVPASGGDLTPMTLRTALGRVLPSYMLPGRWRAFSTLPKNGNGKIDRPLLRDVFLRGVSDDDAPAALVSQVEAA